MPAATRYRSMTDGGPIRKGGCACGAVPFETRGEPLRVGLCHCLRCRKAHASAFYPFAVFTPKQVAVTGELASWLRSPRYDDRFCPACGSRVMAFLEDEVELSLGSLDDPGQLAPQHESWVIRREPWLAPLEVPQFDRDRPDGRI